jgi:hypothetical protein
LQAVKYSKDELFINIMNEEISVNPNVRFFVASDDEIIKNKLLSIFGGGI